MSLKLNLAMTCCAVFAAAALFVSGCASSNTRSHTVSPASMESGTCCPAKSCDGAQTIAASNSTCEASCCGAKSCDGGVQTIAASAAAASSCCVPGCCDGCTGKCTPDCCKNCTDECKAKCAAGNCCCKPGQAQATIISASQSSTNAASCCAADCCKDCTGKCTPDCCKNCTDECKAKCAAGNCCCKKAG